MPGGSSLWIVAAAGLILAVVAWKALRSWGARVRAAERTDARVRDACLAAIAIAQDFRIAVQESVFAKEGAPGASLFARRIDAFAADAGPFPGREEIAGVLGEIGGEADRMSRGGASYLASRARQFWEGWAGTREVWVRHHSRDACRGRRGVWRDPPVRPAPAAAA